MKFIFILFAVLTLHAAAMAQEQGDFSERVTPIEGGAIYDEKMGVDGSAISESYLLTHLVCSKGSRKIRMMLPLGLQDDEISFSIDGEPSSLVETKAGYQLSFKAGDKTLVKDVELKPTNDKRSFNKEQFIVTLKKDDALWKAMASGSAKAMIGTGGTPVALPSGKKFQHFLALCQL